MELDMGFIPYVDYSFMFPLRDTFYIYYGEKFKIKRPACRKKTGLAGYTPGQKALGRV